MSLISHASNVHTAMEPLHQFEKVRQSQILSFLRGVKPEEAELLGPLLALSEHEPLKFISECERLVDPNAFCLKIFPGHVDCDKERDQLYRAAGTAVVLKRNLLHAYISDCIATRTGAYTTVDTSQERVTFDSERFERWSGVMKSFLRQAMSVFQASGVPFVEINYEDLICYHDSEIQCILERAGFHYDSPLRVSSSRMNRQDLRRYATDKVTNPDHMIEALDGLGLESLNDGRQSMHIELGP